MTRVLVVEDDRLVREWLQQALSEEGYQVELARNGNEGMARLDNSPPDLVILDLVMPQMSGFEVLSALDKKGIRIPTIITSGIVIPGVHDYLRTHSQVRILSKPFTAEEMLESVEGLLGRSRRRKKA